MPGRSSGTEGKGRTLRTWLLVVGLLLGVAVVVLTGCNTAAGFGEDIESLGRALSNAAGN